MTRRVCVTVCVTASLAGGCGDRLTDSSRCATCIDSVRSPGEGPSWIEYLHDKGFQGDGSELDEQPIAAWLFDACDGRPDRRLGDALREARTRPGVPG